MAIASRPNLFVYPGVMKSSNMLLDFGDWATVTVEGPDAREFLQGVGTQDITALKSGAALPTLFLTEKGRPVALAWVASDGGDGSFLLLVEPGGADKLLPHLDRLRVMEDVSIAQAPKGLLLVGAVGPGHEAEAGRVAERLPGSRVVRASAMSFLLPATADDPAATERALGALATPEATEAWRLSVGIPRAGVDFGEDRIATELSLEEAISLTKGCYVGQEVVARTTNRGAVRRRRVGFTFAGSRDPLARGTELLVGGSAAGFVTSSTLEPGTGRGLGMGYLTTEALGNLGEVLAVQDTVTARLEVAPWPL